MTYKIRPKRSNVPSKVPLASDLELGELAINMADQKIYTKTPSNAIVELGGGSSTIDLLAVPSDIIPDGDLTRSLGSPTHQWADLYVGNATIYLNNVPLGLDGDLQLTFNGNVIANSDGAVQVDWTNISNIPGGYDSGNITFSGDTISSTNDVVNVSAINYTQLESNSNYVWLDNSGVHVEITDSEGGHEFTFAWANGQAQLQLPSGADIVDSAGNSVLGGGSGVTLPANASGYLTNDGAGNLAWAAGDGTFSGDYNDLVNKPTIPDPQVQSDWNESATESPAYIWNKPTIPSSLSDLGITAGSDGQVLTLNSSLVPVWATLSGGTNTGNITFSGDNINSSNNVVNVSASNYAQLESNNAYVWVENNSATVQVNSMNWVFDNNGNLTLPDLGAEVPSILYANGVSILNGLGGGGNPFNQSLNTNDSVGFIQVRTARLEQGWNNVTKTSGYQYIEPGQTTDIWTSDNVEITSAKFTVQFETKTADPYYTNFDTMTCEIVMAKKRDNGTWTDAPITVYAMVHTSEAPLATFSSYINGDGNAVLTCTPANSISARSYLKVHSVEMQSPSIQNDWC